MRPDFCQLAAPLADAAPVGGQQPRCSLSRSASAPMAAAAASDDNGSDTYLEISVKINRKGAKKAGGVSMIGCPWGATIAAFKRRILDTLGITHVSDVATVRMLHAGSVLDDDSTLQHPRDAKNMQKEVPAILQHQKQPVVCVIPALPPAAEAVDLTGPSNGAAAAAAPAAGREAQSLKKLRRRVNSTSRRQETDLSVYGEDDDPATATAAAAVDDSKNCGICQEDVADEIRAEIACGHLYCFECIKQWCAVQNTCPQCRQRLPSARRAAARSTSRASRDVVQFGDQDRELGSDEENHEGAENDENFVADSEVFCFGMGSDNACKVRFPIFFTSCLIK